MSRKYFLGQETASRLYKHLYGRDVPTASTSAAVAASDAGGAADLPPLYTVRYSAAAGGFWLIRIEDAALKYGGEYVFIEGTSDIGVRNWVKLDSTPEGGGSVWLAVYRDEETGISSAVLTDLADPEATINILIAVCSHNQTTGRATVSQYVVGALILAGASGEKPSGYSGYVYGNCDLQYNNNSLHNLELWGQRMRFEDGLLKEIGEAAIISTIETVPHAAHD